MFPYKFPINKKRPQQNMASTCSSHYLFVLCLITLVLVFSDQQKTVAADPTDGFTALPFDKSVYNIHKPYDLPVDQRYSFVNGVHKLWVYSTDKPFRQDSPTKPRTEINIGVSPSILINYLFPHFVIFFLIF